MSQFDTWETHYSNIGDARKNNFEIVYGKPNQLLLDLDTATQIEQYESMKKQVFKEFQATEIDTWNSKSNHRHVVIELSKELDIGLRIALQVCLGSDPNRGICQIRQLLETANNNVLFKPTLP